MITTSNCLAVWSLPSRHPQTAGWDGWWWADVSVPRTHPQGNEPKRWGFLGRSSRRSIELGIGHGAGIRRRVSFDPIQSAVARRVSALSRAGGDQVLRLGSRHAAKAGMNVATAARVGDGFFFLIGSRVFQSHKTRVRWACKVRWLFSLGVGERMWVLKSHVLDK